jgi:predicted Zn-dependent protease
VEHSAYGKTPAPPEWQEAWNRLHAKLFAFLAEPAQAQQVFSKMNTVAGRYGEAITYFRLSKLDLALEKTQNLINLEPHNPYFNELMGQIYFESGKIKESLPYYRTAIKLKPSSPTLAINVSHALIESGQKPAIGEAIHLLESVVEKNQEYPMAWHFLAVAYGKQNDMGKVALCLAEKALLTGDTPMALSQAKRALALLPQGSALKVRAQDILNTQPNKKEKGSFDAISQNHTSCPGCSGAAGH